MRVSIESIVLFTGVLGLATFHLATPADANPDPAVGAAAPVEIPVEAMVTGAEVAHATAEGFALSLERGDDGGAMTLVVENRGSVAKSVDWDVECASISGSRLSRMGPMERPMGTKRVALTLAPGASERVLLVAPEVFAPAPMPTAAPAADANDINRNAPDANVVPAFLMPIATVRAVVMTHSDERMRAVVAAEAAARAQGGEAIALPSAFANRPTTVATTTLAFLQVEG